MYGENNNQDMICIQFEPIRSLPYNCLTRIFQRYINAILFIIFMCAVYKTNCVLLTQYQCNLICVHISKAFQKQRLHKKNLVHSNM